MKKEDKKQERIENYERTRKEMKEAGYKESSGIISISIYHLHTSLGEGRFCHRQQKSGSFSWAVLCIDLHS